MEKLSKSKVLYYALCVIIIAIPFSISRYFFNVNDLPKSSALMISGSIIISLFAAIFSFSLFKDKNKDTFLYFAPKLDLGILLFLAACIISTVYSLKPSISFWGQYERQVGLITFIYLTAIYFISGYLLREGSRLRNVILIIEIISVIITIYAIFQFFKIEIFNIESANNRPGSFLGNSVFMGGFLIFIIPFSALNAAEKKNKLLVFAFPIIILLGIVVSGTRSAYIALIIQAIIISILRYSYFKDKYKNKKYFVIFLILIFVISLIIILFNLNQGMLYKRVVDALYLYNPRLILWRDAVNIFFKYPLTGPGVAMFPAAFEEFYSNSMRFAEANTVIDHAHNNYLQALFTMGLTGFLAYIYLIFNAFRSARKIANINNAGNYEKKLSCAFIVMLSGYSVYGLTNFDDISILFFLFIFLSILRALLIDKREIKLPDYSKYFVYGFSLVIIILCVINARYSINSLYADYYFKEANVLYSRGEFARALDNNNKAIYLNPRCSAYRFVEASQVYNYCFENSGMNIEPKHKLLSQVELELNKAKENLYYINYCNGILSLVYYEEGRTEEAEKLKTAVLVKDSINVNYRIKLARYLLRENRPEEVKRNLNVILLIKPDEIPSCLLAAMYYNKINDRENAVLYSNKVLKADPENKTALEIINKYK